MVWYGPNACFFNYFYIMWSLVESSLVGNHLPTYLLFLKFDRGQKFQNSKPNKIETKCVSNFQPIPVLCQLCMGDVVILVKALLHYLIEDTNKIHHNNQNSVHDHTEWGVLWKKACPLPDSIREPVVLSDKNILLL